MHILVDIIFKTVLLFFVDGQWEALALLLIGISVNQLRSLPEGTTAMGLPVTTIAYIYTLIFVSSVRCTSYFYLFMLLIPPWFIQSIFFKYVETFTRSNEFSRWLCLPSPQFTMNMLWKANLRQVFTSRWLFNAESNCSMLCVFFWMFLIDVTID